MLEMASNKPHRYAVSFYGVNFGNNVVFYCLQRVMMQIVQELCKRPGLNRTAFEMPTIYIPNPSGKVLLQLLMKKVVMICIIHGVS